MPAPTMRILREDILDDDCRAVRGVKLRLRFGTLEAKSRLLVGRVRIHADDLRSGSGKTENPQASRPADNLYSKLSMNGPFRL